LPEQAPLLVAVSGGQDSMALVTLLRDLAPLHGWRLQLWHGDHGWRPESADQAAELAAWAARQGLPLELERAAGAGPPPRGEAAARHWRYGCLERQARRHGCRHVVTGHTATDRAETVLLNLARGCHRRGLASLRASRPLRRGEGAAEDGADPVHLVRPLLILSREETGRFCRRQGVPVWQDATNADGRLRRNRVRAELLPVLEQLHPGACRRISLQADRLAEEEDHTDELTTLALRGLATGGETPQAPPARLDRRALARLSAAGQRRLLQRWIVDRTGLDPGTGALEELIAALPPQRGAGQRALRGGWRLRWDRRTLVLDPPEPPHGRTP
jgi:tRNA(Ile)-lysidine synthase